MYQENLPPFLNVGISTACFYPEYTETALEKICSLDFKTVELFINTLSEIRGDLLKLLLKFKADNDLNYTSIHPFLSGYEHNLFFSGYTRRLHDSIEYYKYFFEAAEVLDAKYVILHGLPVYRNITVESYYEIFAEINNAAKKFNVLLCQENIFSNHSADPQFISKLIETARKHDDEVYFVFDIKHAVISGLNPVDVIHAMKSNIKHVHLNDYMFDDSELSRANCRLPCYGNIDYAPIINSLRSYKYIGNMVIEVYNNNYSSTEELKQSAQIFTDLIKKI